MAIEMQLRLCRVRWLQQGVVRDVPVLNLVSVDTTIDLFHPTPNCNEPPCSDRSDVRLVYAYICCSLRV